ncbi:MAG: glycine--tRNA ligase subunit beta [Vampirovibrio sp.]
MLNQVFIEVGCEELPAGFLSTVQNALHQKIAQRLEALALTVETIQIEKTPRRLVIRLSGLPDAQADRVEVLKGPPVSIAFDANGQPSQALQGFLRKTGASLDACTQEEVAGTRYMIWHQEKAGQRVKDVIGPVVLDSVMSLEGPRFMRWANNTVLFPRPIRWLLGFWNDEALPLSLALGDQSLESQSYTRGHRLLGQAEILVENPAAYEAQLEAQGKVILSTTARQDLVKRQLLEVAASVQGIPLIEEELLEEVSNILEYPSVLLGRFDEAYLKIPKPVLITVMKTHQRYFPVENEAGDLLPYFLVASNGDTRFAENIVAGNERVLVARFEDAKFFYEEDIKTPLEARLPALAGVTFQKGLGSLKEKTERIQALSAAFADALVLDTDTRQHIQRASLLCKADLVTSMVFELTELQGEVGMYYALQEGEASEVATAIQEHYLPRFQGDGLPTTVTGMVVSLADKIDTLVALLSQSKMKMPSGSKDPLGLRRVVNGILLTILEFNVHGALKAWCEQAYYGLGDLAQDDWASTWERLEGFMQQRLLSFVNEAGFANDVVQAVQASFSPWEDLPYFMAKVDALQVKRQDAPDLMNALYAPAHRIDKMLGRHYNANADAELLSIQSSLFEDAVEAALYDAVKNALEKDNTLSMINLAPVVENFFEAVMVMSENPAIRQNRIDLLSVLHRLYLNRYGRLSLLVMN